MQSSFIGRISRRGVETAHTGTQVHWTASATRQNQATGSPRLTWLAGWLTAHLLGREMDSPDTKVREETEMMRRLSRDRRGIDLPKLSSQPQTPLCGTSADGSLRPLDLISMPAEQSPCGITHSPVPVQPAPVPLLQPVKRSSVAPSQSLLSPVRGVQCVLARLHCMPDELSEQHGFPVVALAPGTF